MNSSSLEVLAALALSEEESLWVQVVALISFSTLKSLSKGRDGFCMHGQCLLPRGALASTHDRKTKTWATHQHFEICIGHRGS